MRIRVFAGLTNQLTKLVLGDHVKSELQLEKLLAQFHTDLNGCSNTQTLMATDFESDESLMKTEPILTRE